LRVLALDTALQACSAALFDAAADRSIALASRRMERGHAEALMPMVAAVFAEAELAFADIDRLVVTTGPGSFTGIRVAVAAARAFALASGLPLIGVSTLTALSAPLLSRDEGLPVAAAIDARHERVYFQMFAPGGRSLVPARLLPVREAARSIGSGRVQIVGSGASAVAEALGDARAEIFADAVPDAEWVARLGAVAAQPSRPPRPLYLKAADATPQTGGRLIRAGA
jgi:tRNA threonylcarbamoyladenosine biosynthesis protein TsaB